MSQGSDTAGVGTFPAWPLKGSCLEGSALRSPSQLVPFGTACLPATVFRGCCGPPSSWDCDKCGVFLLPGHPCVQHCLLRACSTPVGTGTPVRLRFSCSPTQEAELPSYNRRLCGTCCVHCCYAIVQMG